MAIYRLEAKVFSREKRGRSVVAAAAYRNGTKMRDERNDRVFDYSRRQAGVVQSVILSPEDAPEFCKKSESLWGAVEAGERRIDAQLAREIVLSLPKELSTEDQFKLAVGWAQKELVNTGMVAEVSLHHPKRGKNVHAHILCTMRKLENGAFSAKKAREWNSKELLAHFRESWADAVNKSLEEAGRPERVDHRSLKAQGIDRQPEPKIGVSAMAMKRRGVEKDPWRLQLVRKVKMLNELRPMIRAMRTHGEIQHYGMAQGFWDKTSFFAGRVREQACHLVKGAWRKIFDSNRHDQQKNNPTHTR